MPVRCLRFQCPSLRSRGQKRPTGNGAFLAKAPCTAYDPGQRQADEGPRWRNGGGPPALAHDGLGGRDVGGDRCRSAGGHRGGDCPHPQAARPVPVRVPPLLGAVCPSQRRAGFGGSRGPGSVCCSYGSWKYGHPGAARLISYKIRRAQYKFREPTGVSTRASTCSPGTAMAAAERGKWSTRDHPGIGEVVVVGHPRSASDPLCPRSATCGGEMRRTTWRAVYRQRPGRCRRYFCSSAPHPTE